MSTRGLGIDQFTLGSILTACGASLTLKEGSQIHAYIIRTDIIDDVFVGSSFVDMYLKCKSVNYAERVFSIISSCANLASLEEGAHFHGQALVSGLISFITVSNALVTLYGKCGTIDKSSQLFYEMNIKDEVSYTALISGYSQFGEANKTIDLFDQITFLNEPSVVDSLLWSCHPQALTLIFDFPFTDVEKWGHVVKFMYEKLLQQEDQLHHNIEFVMSSSSSNAEMNFSDLPSLLKALPRDG